MSPAQLTEISGAPPYSILKVRVDKVQYCSYAQCGYGWGDVSKKETTRKVVMVMNVVTLKFVFLLLVASQPIYKETPHSYHPDSSCPDQLVKRLAGTCHSE